MSKLRYLSLASACHYNEDVRLVMRRGETTGHGKKWKEQPDLTKGYRDLSGLPNLTITYLEDEFPEIAELNLPEVHTGDLFMWRVISERGGWVADMDIVFHAPVPEELPDLALPRFTGSPRAGYIPVSFLGGRPCELTKLIYATAIETMHVDRYESCGTEVLGHLPVGLELPFTLPETIVYPFAGTLFKWYKNWMWRGWEGTIPKGCIGTHWYAGANAKYNADFNAETAPGLIGQQVRKFLEAGGGA